ncbi:MAG TPA: polysaccharide deacetylase family protein [Steroidobacteraceae bacterium]|jgi:peptidoglycan/xylan/chitin deacetylase (PgdA/CDA1 family)
MSRLEGGDSMERVYLTFDDGPDRDFTPRVLDVLAQAEMQATFFVIGECARREPELIRRIAEGGHAIGNHTYSHRHPWLMTPRAARAQVRDGANAVADVLGYPPRLYRPPHGRLRPCMVDEAHKLGEHIVLWNVSAIDFGPLGSAKRIGQRLASVSANDIVLMHDGRNRHNRPDQLLEVLPGFLAHLRERGLHSASLPLS